MVHWKIFVPAASPVIVLVGKSELVIVPVPEIKFQAPVPTAGKFPFMVVVGEEMQRVWLDPAVAIEGT
jgi:hypothetical protein